MTKFERVVGILRYGLLGAVALFALWVGYGAAADRRYDFANGITGELVAGTSVGQSFEARYDGLDGVEIHAAALGSIHGSETSTVVFRLEEEGSGEEVASGRIEVGADAWYTLGFAALESSRGKRYVLTVEDPDSVPGKSVVLHWFQPNRRGDPYLEGQAFQGGIATPGDLAFGLKYQASAWQVWSVMIGEAGKNTSGFVVWGLLILAGAGAAALAGPGWSWIEQKGRRGRRGLAAALALGFVHGLLYMVIMPPWQGPDEYAHYAYAALLDRHDLDNGAVERLELGGIDKDAELVAAINASADRNDFTRRLKGTSAPGAPTRTDAYVFQQVRQPPTYYWLCAAGLRVARTIGIGADPVANPDVALYVMRFVSVLLTLVVVAMAWAALGARVAIGVGLLPMHAFVGSMINNDILAEVMLTALVLGLVGLVKATFSDEARRWPTRYAAALAGICTLVAGLGVVTKATAPVAGIPLLIGGLGVWAGVGIARRFGKERRISLGRWVGVGIIVLLAVLFAVVGPREDASAGWFRSYDPLVSAQRVKSAFAHQGNYVLQLDGVKGEEAMQRIVPPAIVHPALDVTLSGYVAFPGEISERNGEPVVAEIRIMDGAREAGSVTIARATQGEQGWVPVEVSGKVEGNGEQIVLVLGVKEGDAPGAKVWFDDMSIKVEGVSGEWRDPVFTGAMVDPSGETARWGLRPWLEDALPNDAGSMVSAVMSPLPFSKAELWKQYGQAQWMSFWGSFGWLSIDLPGILYQGIGVVVIAACVGLTMRGWRKRNDGWGWRGWFAVVAAASLVIAIAVGFAKQTDLTAYGGLPSPPQGRYLFVLIVPVVWLLGMGLKGIFEKLPEKWARTLKMWALDWPLMLAIYCLLALVVPYYYG